MKNKICCNPYSLLPTEVVIQLVGSLENLRMIFYNQIIQVDKCDSAKLYTVFRIRDNYADYIIVEIPFAGQPPYNKINGDDFRFFSINYASDGTLIQSLINENIVEVPVAIIRTRIFSTFRGIPYNLFFNTYQFGDPSIQKESICNLFAFPGFNFVLYGRIFFRFSVIDYFPVITYVGKISPDSDLIKSVFYYDYANGSLLGIVESQLVFFWNTRSFTLANYFPDLKGVNYTLAQQPQRVPMNVIIGGQNVYQIEERKRNPIDPNDWNIIRKATAARTPSYLANEPSGGILEYTSLKEFILINTPPNTQKLYIVAFTVVKFDPPLNDFPRYAVIGFSDFLDTQEPVRTFPKPVEFVQTKDPSFQQYETIFFKYTETALIVYFPGFENWRRLNKASVAVNDLNMSLLTSNVSSNDFFASLSRNAEIPTPQAPIINTYERRFGPPIGLGESWDKNGYEKGAGYGGERIGYGRGAGYGDEKAGYGGERIGYGRGAGYGGGGEKVGFGGGGAGLKYGGEGAGFGGGGAGFGGDRALLGKGYPENRRCFL